MHTQLGKTNFSNSTGTAEPRPNQPLYNAGFGRRKILTDGGNTNKISIPLNLYSYFAAFKNNLHPNIKTNIIVELEKDDNIFSEMLRLQTAK